MRYKGHYTIYVTDIDDKTSYGGLWFSDVRYIKQAKRIARRIYAQRPNGDDIVLMWQFKNGRQKLHQFYEGRFYRVNLRKRKKSYGEMLQSSHVSRAYRQIGMGI